MLQSTTNLRRFTLPHMGEPAHDWYLRQWLESTGTTQATLARSTGWDRRKTSFLVNGHQEYRRQDVNDAALALKCEPFEILMHPAEAMAMRSMRRALSLVADRAEDYKPQPDDLPEWGRNGTEN